MADSLGLSNVVADMQTLAGLCGERFAPCPLLLNLQQHQEDVLLQRTRCKRQERRTGKAESENLTKASEGRQPPG